MLLKTMLAKQDPSSRKQSYSALSATTPELAKISLSVQFKEPLSCFKFFAGIMMNNLHLKLNTYNFLGGNYTIMKTTSISSFMYFSAKYLYQTTPVAKCFFPPQRLAKCFWRPGFATRRIIKTFDCPLKAKDLQVKSVKDTVTAKAKRTSYLRNTLWMRKSQILCMKHLPLSHQHVFLL